MYEETRRLGEGGRRLGSGRGEGIGVRGRIGNPDGANSARRQKLTEPQIKALHEFNDGLFQEFANVIVATDEGVWGNPFPR